MSRPRSKAPHPLGTIVGLCLALALVGGASWCAGWAIHCCERAVGLIPGAAR